MSTSTAWQVTWNADLACYQISEQAGQGRMVSEMQVDGDAWQEWLERVSSFAFQSKEGTHVTALKERRGGGRVYWIAYRKIGGKLKRKYLGPSKEVTLNALERVVTALVQPEVPTASPVTSPPVINSMTPSSERLPEQLLATKLLVPAPAHPLIRRSRLETLLNEGTRHPLTLVSAPAGFGKTSLLEGWVQSLPQEHLQVAWVSLDGGDNDAVRFWTYVLTALDRCEPGISQHALTLLRTPQAPALEYVLTTLINAVLPSTNTQVLILDDYHVISEPAIHTSLDFLIEHQPSQLRLVLLSRSDPPLKLSRLRARGRLLEVRDDDLRCSMEEAMQFLGEVMGIRLPNDLLQQVMTRTEGWLVGLQLLGLSLRGHADPTDLLDALAGTERYILDYLTEEVLGQQPASIQEFLLRTSILDPLSGPGISHSQSLRPSS
jgi:LuxR family maltose regulon positive regulatory protein